jgi:hypothetical protein
VNTTNDLKGKVYLGDNGDRLRTAAHKIGITRFVQGKTEQFGLTVETQTDHPVPNMDDLADPKNPFMGRYVTHGADETKKNYGIYQTISPFTGSINRNMISGFYNSQDASGTFRLKLGISTPKFDSQKWIHDDMEQGNFKKESTRPVFGIGFGSK